MFARITQYKMKDGSRPAATALLEELKDKIMALDGMIRFINVMNEDGTGYVISVVRDEATSNANAPHVAEIWGAFASYLEEAPIPKGYDVVVDWAN